MHTIWSKASLKNYWVQLPSSGLLTLSTWWLNTGFWKRRKCSLKWELCTVFQKLLKYTWRKQLIGRTLTRVKSRHSSSSPTHSLSSKECANLWKSAFIKKVMVKTLLISSATIFYLRVDIYMPATHLLQILIAEQQSKKGNAKGKKKKGEVCSETLWDPI